MSPGAERAARPRHVAAAVIGNALEFYDFITYAFFAIQIGHAFFPAHNAYVSLMLSLATFGVGFVTRPLGALVLGAYGDRAGRRPAMMLSFVLMGGSIIALALIPSYSRIGLAAPLLAVAARMVQGFSLGGEVGPATAFLMEAAPARGRGLAVSWQGASQNVAALAAGLIGVGLSAVLPPAALDAWGWRIAFLVGTLTLPVGLWIRQSLPETLPPRAPVAAARREPVLALLRGNARIICLGLVVMSASTIATYIGSYRATFAQHALAMTPQAAYLATSVTYSTGIVSILVGGRLCDRYGRRALMLWPMAAYLVAILPAYAWIIHARSPLALALGTSVLALFGAMPAGAFYAAVTESLPARIRGGAFGLIYTLPVTVLGGTTQLLVTWLIHVTGDPMALAWYQLAAGAAGALGMLFIVETSPAKVAPALVAAE